MVYTETVSNKIYVVFWEIKYPRKDWKTPMVSIV